ncbi:gluconokinase, GntK/IdnK-type [Psychrosphaera saromensis]|nr:gluconokinase, GntK/IdnK-type [Psychrosphaera saromensis]
MNTFTNTIKNDLARTELFSPLTMSSATTFLWNSKMVAQINCRGYMTSQFMQPEPSKYSYAPNLEAKTFIQPEQPYYADHPGRFFYIKNEETGEMFSAPYEPMRVELDSFCFSAGTSDVKWIINKWGIEFTITLSLTKDLVVELWSVEVVNGNSKALSVSIYPCFSIGYMSWMSQSADFNAELSGIVATSVTPYQKVEDYFKNQELKDLTYMVADQVPDSWCCNLLTFRGEGGMHNPSMLQETRLENKPACYETPVGVQQFKQHLLPNEKQNLNIIFGPAKNVEEIKTLKAKLLAKPEQFKDVRQDYSDYINKGKGTLSITSPDADFDHYVNHWLPRQVFYHGDVNRLSTDPQTRNFLQDAMGMIYIAPAVTRERLLLALSQQKRSGAMPDGILLTDEAELKYINQVPHTDHCVWLSICLQAYLDETGDSSILSEQVAFEATPDAEPETASVKVHLDRAMQWLLSATDARGLSYIEQGDWCDPMNMVGYKGKGVSAWLSLASSYAISCWNQVCETYYLSSELTNAELSESKKTIAEFASAADTLNLQVNKHCWNGDWFARGITDDGNVFGTKTDVEGRIFLNPQSWAMLSNAASDSQYKLMNNQIFSQLATPYGVTMLAPSFTQMREDIGRVTQKSAGVSENGSVYNHAAMFYGFALYTKGQNDLAFDVLKRMLPSQQNADAQGQLPVFVPNYYRGAYYQHPHHAGRSSHLFNTGTVAWYFRSVVEGLCGLKGCGNDLLIQPQLPSHWPTLKVQREFRGASIELNVIKSDKIKDTVVTINGEVSAQHKICDVQAGQTYKVEVLLPLEKLSLPQLTIVMGVSGCGKNAVGEQVAALNNRVFVDADSFHDESAKQKMASGTPLTDDDRLPWLARIQKFLAMLLDNRQSCVLAYSGLKAAHREMFTQLGFELNVVHLNVAQEVIAARLEQRESHFFDPKLLSSQFDALEVPSSSEAVITIDADKPLEDIVREINQELSND